MKKILVIIALFAGPILSAQSISSAVADSACVCYTEVLPQIKADNQQDSLKACITNFLINNSQELFEEHELKNGYTVENIQFIYRKVLAILEDNCDTMPED